MKQKIDPNPAPGLSVFPNTAYWRVLEPNTEEIQNPGNHIFGAACASTANKQYIESEIITKHNFDNTFDIPVFKENVTCV